MPRADVAESTSPPSLLDGYLDRWDVRSKHSIVVNSSRRTTYRAARELDLGRSIPVLALFAIRAIPHLLTGKTGLRRSLTLDDLAGVGFAILDEEPDRELVLGAVGRFWRPDSGIRPIDAREFASFDEPGYAKGAFNLRVEERDARGCLLSTETRVVCTDASARRKFSAYWRLIGPFSGAIRHMMLREVRLRAE